MRRHVDVTAGILVGGRGRRLGGVDKARLRAGESSFLEVIAAALEPRVSELFLLGRAEQRFEELSLRLLPDPVPDGGPLSGLLALLEASRTDWVFLVACDLPHFDPAVLDLLLAEPRIEEQVVIAATGGSVHPTTALYNRRLRDRVRRRLQGSTGRARSLKGLIEQVPTLQVQLPARLERALHNVNRPQDLPE